MSILNHADFLKATRDVRIVPKEELRNEATKNTYFYSRFFKTHGLKFKGGTKLVDRVQAVNAGTFGFYNPNEEFAPRQVDTLRSLEMNWAFAKSEYVLLDETSELNSGDDDAYLDYVMSLEQGCVVDTANGMEEALWTKPDYEKMESLGANQAQHAYSIPAFITRDGLAPSSSNGGLATGSSAWTNIAGVNIGQNSWFQNKFATYHAANPDSADNGLISAFDEITLQIQFEKPEGVKNYSTDDDLQNYCIATSLDGTKFYKSRLRERNDRMERLNDPRINGPQYDGIPLKYVSELDTHGWTNGQPDFFFINQKKLRPWFHSRRYMHEKIETGGAKQPNSTVVYKFTWYNLFPLSRRNQGRVSAA